MAFDINTAQPVLDTPQGNKPGGKFDIQSAKPVEVSGGDKNPQTEYDKFRESEVQTMSMSKEATGQVTPKESAGKDISPDLEKQSEYPSHSFLNHPVAALGDISNLTGDVLYDTFAKPLGLAKEASNTEGSEERDISRAHPIGSILAGTAPFIATSPLFPESLLGLISQFATVSGLNELGRQRMDESLMKPLASKALDVSRETLKGAMMGPIWHYSGELKFLAHPVAGALVRAGIRGAGTTALDKVYGGDLAQSFKDGGVMFALSLMFESPGLAKTVLGRGIINHANNLYADMAVKKGLPEIKIDPESDQVQQQILDSTKGLATEIKGVPKQDINQQMNDEITSSAQKIMQPGESISQNINRTKDWITATLRNDENSTDQELVDYFKQEGGFSDEVAQHIVSRRGKALNMPLRSVTPELSKDIGNVIDWEQSQESGGRTSFIDADGERQFIGNPSGHSQAMQAAADRNGSYEKVYDLLKRYQTGEKLTDLQAKDVEGIIQEYQNTIKKGLDETLKGIEDAKRELTESETKEVIDAFKEERGLSDSAWAEQEAAEVTPSGQLRHELQPPIPGSLFQEPGELFAKPPELKITNPETLKGLGEEGKLDIQLIPGITELSEGLARASQEYIENLEPTTVSGAAEFTSQDLRERLGRQAQLFDRLEVLLSAAKKMFDKASKESITKSYTAAERGEEQENPELQKVYDSLQYLLTEQRDRVRDLGKGKLENFIENYMPHIWEDPKKANMLSKFFSRRPFEGPKGFLKKRSIETFADGIEAGLTPVSWNPVDLTLLKMREMEKYILAHSAVKANIETGFVKRVNVGQQPPEGWQRLNDNISTIFGNPMIKIKEAFDQKQMDQLNKLAKDLDIEHLRKVKIGGKAWGKAEQSGKRVTTKFAGPVSVLAHELGHAIDFKYGLREMMFGEKGRPMSDFILQRMIKKAEREGRGDDVKRMTDQMTRNKELRALADAREQPSSYARKGVEKMAVMMESFIHAPEIFKKVAPETYKYFTDFLASKPELKGFLDVKPSVVLGANQAEVYAGGNVISAYLYAHPDSARIFNNYLSPGLRGKWIYDVYRTAGNSLVQFRLGISGFHAGFTSLDATISTFAKGLNQLSRGNLKGFGEETLKTVPAPVLNFMEGRKLWQSWFGTDNGPLTNLLAEAYAMGGGRARMDKFYATNFVESMNKSLKEGKLLTSALKAPFWLVQQFSRPLMEYIVPRQKMGVFSNLMKMEIEQNPNMSHEQMRAVAQRIVNSVDNRMGQLVYDNLMINRTMKDLGMASVQSLGWNIGSVREIGGGVQDLFKSLNDLRQGKSTQLSYRTAYIMALPMIVGLYGAIYQYLHVGEWPKDMKDYFHPRTGGVDKNGLPSRVNLPSYMKDIESFAQDPVKTAVNKLNPVNSELIEMFQNKDYFGTEIRNVDDPWVKQAFDELMFVAGGFEPYSFENLNRDTRRDFSSRIEPFLGIVPARYDIDMTKAEKAALEFEKGNIPQGARTKESAAHSKQRSDLRNQFLVDGERQPLIDAVNNRVITAKEKNEIIKEQKMSRIERLTRHLSADQVLSLIPKAESDQEREDLERIAKKKRSNKRGAGTWTDQDQALYDKFMPENDQ